MPALTFSPSTRVGDIVAVQPLLAGVFARLGIDYCCGGKISLAEACAAKRLDPARVAVLLDAAAHLGASTATVDAASMTLTALADHIESTHHLYLKQELPVMVEQAQRVAMKHAWRDRRLTAVGATVEAHATEMVEHMRKEEQVLFPLVRELERNGGAASTVAAMARSIAEMEAEHDAAGQALATLRELTDGFVPDHEACNTHRALLAGLARLEQDLHQHVHKENNVLFPRALVAATACVPA